MSQTLLLFQDRDRFEEDCTGVVSNVPHFGFVCCVFWWLEWGCGFGGEHRSGEAALSSHAFRGSLASVGQHGARWPGHPVQAVPARCLLSPSCLLWRPLSEAVALQGVGMSQAPCGVGVAGEIHGGGHLPWEAFLCPMCGIRHHFPASAGAPGSLSGALGTSQHCGALLPTVLQPWPLGASAFIVRVGGTLSLAGAPRCSSCACLSPRISHFSGEPWFLLWRGCREAPA